MVGSTVTSSMTTSSLVSLQDMSQGDRERVVSGVTLSSDVVEKLKDTQITTMKETVYEVNNNVKIMGMCIRSTSQYLVRLKESIPRGNWTKFVKSELIEGLKPRQIQDLTSSWEKWLKDTDLTDSQLQLVGSRTLARLGNVSKEARDKAKQKIKKKDGVFGPKDLNEILFQLGEEGGDDGPKNVMDIVKQKNDITRSMKTQIANLEKENKKLKKKNSEIMTQLTTTTETLKAQIFSYKDFENLQEENSNLQQQINELQSKEK